MKKLFEICPWKVAGACAILFQTLLTLNHIKFFPFSDHGIFELPRKLNGQHFYRVITKESSPSYVEEGILFEVHAHFQDLIEYKLIAPADIVPFRDQEVIAIDRFTMAKSEIAPLFKKTRILDR